MRGLKNMLIMEKRNLEEIIRQIDKEMKGFPPGTLRISTDQNKPRYYHCTEDTNKNGIYIPKSNTGFAQKLAQKSYDIRLKNCAQKRLAQINKLLKNYSDDEMEEIYLKESAERRKLINPIVLPWKNIVNRWYKKEYQGKGFQEGAAVILTDRGERVRSKSEKIIADYLYHHGILYKYECPLSLNGYGVIYPDFTLLSPSTGEEIYWEHNGMMDDPKYARMAVKKIDSYEKNGIFPGDRLILTFETSDKVLSTQTIERYVQKYLI